MPCKQAGFVHPFLLLAVALSLFALGNIKTTINFPNKVEGVFLARGGDDSSGGSSGSSGSDSRNSNSTESVSASSGSGSDSSSGSNKTTDSSAKNTDDIKTPKPFRAPELKELKLKKEVEKPEELKDEIENEVENELETEEIKNIEFKNIEGELESESKDASGSAHRRNNHRGEKIKIHVKIKDATREAELEVEGNELKLETKNATASSNFPLSLDDNGQLFVSTPKGLRQIRILPDQAAETAKEAGIQNQIDRIELIENKTAGSSDDTVFKIHGKRSGRLFGIIPLESEVESEVGAQTGAITSVTEPFWLRLLSSFVN